jgi:hypothetical protein
MPPKRTFDTERATLEALRDVSPEAAEPELAKAFNLRNKFHARRAEFSNAFARWVNSAGLSET